MGLGTAGENLKRNIAVLEKKAEAKEREIGAENQTLTELKARLAEVELAYKDAKGYVDSQAVRCRNLGSELNAIRREIEMNRESVSRVDNILSRHKKGNNLVVTDHALIRYLERKFDLNLEELRGEIVTDDLRLKVEAFGNGTYGAFVVKDQTVITVLPKGDKPTKPLRKSG